MDQLLKNRTIKGPNARNWPSSRETETYALELRRRGIAEKIRTLELNDPHDWSINHRPSVERAAIPPMFRILVGELQSMEGEVSPVEEKYLVDCSKLKKSVENAVTQVGRHIFCWRVLKYRMKTNGKQQVQKVCHKR